jgi:hypothetical protein
LLRVVDASHRRGLRVAVATQTNSQADDICDRLAHQYRHLPVCRFSASNVSANGPVPVVQRASELPDHCVAVGTVAKWGMVDLERSFDVVLVDEAWQMAWADFMLLAQVAPRFVLIGDPGQIPPVVTIAVERWETSPRAPHQPAPDLLLSDPKVPKVALDLPATYRLPADSVELVRHFYDFEFGSWAAPGERSVTTRRARDGGDPVDPAIDTLAWSSAAILAIDTPPDGPPLRRDDDVARLAVHLVERLLERNAMVQEGTGETRALTPDDIGITATHRVMNGAIERKLPAGLRGRVKVDTAERWQGLERAVMVVVHPLSGVVHPSPFDVETGRLCVMASRHRAGMIVISRDHVPDTLATHIPAGEQAPGRPDVTGRGHEAHERFWWTLKDRGCVTQVA